MPALKGAAAAFFMALATLPAAAAQKSYVVCDNGLRCFVAPCPSTSALEILTGTLRKGIWADTSGLSRAERREIEESSALYHGSRVVRGRIKQRTKTFMGKPRTLPYLVISGIERRSTAREQKLCRQR